MCGVPSSTGESYLRSAAGASESIFAPSPQQSTPNTIRKSDRGWTKTGESGRPRAEDRVRNTACGRRRRTSHAPGNAKIYAAPLFQRPKRAQFALSKLIAFIEYFAQ